jgi:hypothetical protein
LHITALRKPEGLMSAEIERLAARLARLYQKNTGQHVQKWEHMTADDRSLWRLIARAAQEETDTPERVRFD